jgi:membrane protease YdiL (CAAX protease family)
MMHTTEQVDWKGVGSFVAISIGLGWLVASPLWISGEGLRHRYFAVILAAMMFTPAIATLIVTRFISRPTAGIRRATGLSLGRGQGWGWYWLFAWLGVPLMVIAAPFVAAAFGLVELDLVDFSGYRTLLEQAGGAAALEQLPIGALILVQLASGILLGPIINAIPTFGEEWGWRGYLLPALLPLGQWPALLISGTIWGLWHAPAILLGYNYPLHPQFGVLLMVGMCIVWGILFGWTRLATGSVWPAVLGHGALNATGGVLLLFLSSDVTVVDSALVGVTGLTGWIIPALVIAVLVVLRRLPVADAPDNALTVTPTDHEQTPVTGAA